MEYTALWGPKGFIVSPSKIVPMLGLETDFAVKAETSNEVDGVSTTNYKGRELQSLSLSTIYVRGAGVDPRGQIAEWEALVGKSHPLYIGDQRFGPKRFMLKSVNASDILLSNTGKFLRVTIGLKFEEYAPEGKTTTTAATTAGAMKATASAADKAALKPTKQAVIME